jgi:hypothetical protein
MGGGKSSGSQSAVLTPEQKDLLATQTAALKETFLPAYQNTIAGAKDVLYGTAANALPAMQSALGVTERGGQVAQTAGEQGLASGVTGLQQLFNPNYKQEQIDAAMQPAREQIREDIGAQNAMFGGAGGAGSSRYALARENLKQLGEQRLATAAATASSGVEANRAAAASKLADVGTSNIPIASQLYSGRVGLAQTPLDAYSKYASIIFGTPQGATTPNFAGTQGSSSSGSGFNFGFGGGK